MRYYREVLGRTVLDTNVIVAAVRSDRGASRALLRGALEGRYAVLASVPLMLEYEAVLTRPEHLDAAGISRDDAGAILDALARMADPVRISYLWRPLLPDPGDDLVLETAGNGGAEAIVTLNRRDFEPASARFDVALLAPSDAVRNMETW